MENINPVRVRRDEHGNIYVDGIEKAEVVSCLNSDLDDSNNLIDLHKYLCAAFDPKNLDEWALFVAFHLDNWCDM